MSHVLDTYPLDFSRPEVQQLRSTLLDTFDSPAAVRDLMRSSGMQTGYVDMSGPMHLVWTAVLDTARKQDRLRLLLGAAAKDPNAAAIRPVLDALLTQTPAASTDPSDSIDAIAWKVDADDRSGLERTIEAQSTLLDVSFLERGLELSPSVAKLLVTLNDGKRYYGTAFRIGDDLLLTNHHVLFDEVGPATAVEAWFGFELAFGGAPREYTIVACRPDTIVGKADHDWAVVRTGTAIPESARIVPLTGAAEPEPLDRVYIIQHPQGREKKIGMIHNVVVAVTDDVIQYRTDTDAGSSGSPVFNEQWQVVGLHHRWGSTVNDGRTEYYNQGRRIERVVAALTAEGLV
ncbi:trypsin-like peptidase domain-containing protein [Intrasporangium sp.]|uniref:trypsin-like peptidase domain-containing protein n=1 Tax=Intrasporangium sp. TaxID=1925024 RepID=UPI00293A10C5|nr:trypsin-like peptidase domain-containing protein [Intrasporangium sp.]MDV3222685.1 serine protease [Intrasporangium sp.]